MTRTGRIIAALWALALLTAPCRAGKADDTLTWSTSRELAFTMPYFVTSREQLIIESLSHDTLVYRTPQSGEYQPLLAKSWRWLDDTTLEFTLRDDVVFQDGRPFGAADVAYTLNKPTACAKRAACRSSPRRACA